jgi:hypothetical protein
MIYNCERKFTLSIKVAFIDSVVNNRYLSTIINSKVKVIENYTITNGIVIPYDAKVDELTHATLCAKMFYDNVSSNCELYFIQILDTETNKTNLTNMLIALEWCKQENIKLINLSIGTTVLDSAFELYKKIQILENDNIVIVAACSNDGKMTFPAAFDNVIGVKAISSKNYGARFLYENNTIDNIDIICNINEEVIEYKNVYHKIYSSNSYAAPIITAKTCNYISDGFNTIEKIRKKLQLDSVKKVSVQKKFTKYYKRIECPIIAILNDFNTRKSHNDRYLAIKNILAYFYKEGYNGICLSDQFKTNIIDHIFAIKSLDLEINDILNYYGNMCNTDFIIMDINMKSLYKKRDIKDIDIILYCSKLDKMQLKKYSKIKKVQVSNFNDSETVFNDVYKLLIS